MLRFLRKCLDGKIDATILEKCPIPDFDYLVLYRLDTVILDLINPQVQKSVYQQDNCYIIIGKRINTSLGSLFQLWRLLSDARQSVQDIEDRDNSDIDINKVPRLIEQTATIISRIHVWQRFRSGAVKQQLFVYFCFL